MRGLVLVVLVMVSLSGCALTDSTINLTCDKDYPGGTDPQGFRIPKRVHCQTDGVSKPEIAAISFTGITDKRAVATPKVLYNKRNNYGKTLGLVSSQEVVSEFVSKSLVRVLEREGIKVTGGNKLVLSGNISKIDNEAMVGFWSVSWKTFVTGEVSLNNSQGVLKENIYAEGLEEGIGQVTDEDYENSVRGAINDFVLKTVDFVKRNLARK